MSDIFYVGAPDMTFVVGTFRHIRARLAEALLETTPFNAGTWQKLDISGSAMHETYELRNVSLQVNMPRDQQTAVRDIGPDLPWAEDHFQERVEGFPVNPGRTHTYWPYHAHGADLHLTNGKYDHNYMERYWPKDAGRFHLDDHLGIRFDYGDLNDVVNLLKTDPGTRQAYLPVWFPEDTGAIHHQRVPCSLGYHFMIRDGVLHTQYSLRSCEIVRHFTNDIYLTTRLSQWVADKVGVMPGMLTTHIASFHGFVGDTSLIEEMSHGTD